MMLGEGEGYEGHSIQEAQRQDDRRQERDIQEANDRLTAEELRDLHIPFLYRAKARLQHMHVHEDPSTIVGPMYGGKVDRGMQKIAERVLRVKK